MREGVAERRALVVALYRSGMKAAEIGRRVGLSRMMVYKHLAQAGEPRCRRDRIGDPEALAARIVALRAEGLLLKQIAHEVGRSQSTVCYYLRGAA